MSSLKDFLGVTVPTITPPPSGGSGTTSKVIRSQIFSANNSFTVPVDVTVVRAIVIGGGGGGGHGYDTTYNLGGGGAGGGYIDHVFEVTPTEILNIVIGAGGIGANKTAYTDTIGAGERGGNTTVLSNQTTGIQLRAMGGGAGIARYVSLHTENFKMFGASEGGLSSSGVTFAGGGGGAGGKLGSVERLQNVELPYTDRQKVHTDARAAGSKGHYFVSSSSAGNAEGTSSGSRGINGYSAGGSGAMNISSGTIISSDANIDSQSALGSFIDIPAEVPTKYGCGGSGGHFNNTLAKSSSDGFQGAVFLYWVE